MWLPLIVLSLPLAVFALSSPSKSTSTTGRSCILNAYIYSGNTYLENYMSVGDGTFKQVVTTLTATASSFSSFGSMDANGDGLTDSFHAYVNAGIMTIEVYLAQESGVFNQVVSKYSGYPTYLDFIGAMDINGDGKDDIIQQWNNGGYINFVSFFSEGDGNFRTVMTGTSRMSGAFYIIPMDVDGDGKSDLLNVEDSYSCVWIGVFLSVGDGTFTAKGSSYPIIISNVKFFSMDVNNDGKQDLVQFTHLEDKRTGIQTYISNGDGTFATYINTQSGPTSTTSYAVSGSALYGDVSYGVKTNDDGTPVVGIIEEGSGTGYACYLSKDDGSYTYRNETHSTPSSSSNGVFLMTDLNGDGYSDAVKVQATGYSGTYGVVLWSYLAQD
eukprot:gene27128-35850_t